MRDARKGAMLARKRKAGKTKRASSFPDALLFLDFF
jgi:hypothetical protein